MIDPNKRYCIAATMRELDVLPPHPVTDLLRERLKNAERCERKGVKPECAP